MIATLSVKNLGPCADITVALDPAGVTTIEGPSEAGKTTLIDAACLLLTGRDSHGEPMAADAIREGATSAVLSLETAKGAKIGKRVTAKGEWTRRLALPGKEGESLATESELRAKLGKIGTHSDAVRVVLAPLAWVPLLQSEKGRPFRDVLASVLPPADLRVEVARLMAPHELRAGDPVDVKAEAARKDANRARDEADGRLSQARASLAALAGDVAGPSAADVDHALDLRAAVTAWEDYDDARARRQAEAGAVAAWTARGTALGEAPAYDEAAHAAAVEALRVAREGAAKAAAAEREKERKTADKASKEAARVAADAARAEAEAKAARDAAAAEQRRLDDVAAAEEKARREAEAVRIGAERAKAEAVAKARAERASPVAPVAPAFTGAKVCPTCLRSL